MSFLFYFSAGGSGRALRPRDCEHLVLYLKDVNLPKPDKWGTSQTIAFLQQVIYVQQNLQSC